MNHYVQESASADVIDDPQARALLRQAFENTARWQKDFKGFTAQIRMEIDEREEAGTVTVRGPMAVETTLKDEELKKAAEDNLASIAGHRGPRTFEESDGKLKLIFGPGGRHPFGRSVLLDGDAGNFYRIQEGRIWQINRRSPRMSFVINVEESVKNPDGKFLTAKYSVYYFDPGTGALRDVESYTDAYQRVGQFNDLPALRRVISAKGSGVTIGTMRLSGHQLL